MDAFWSPQEGAMIPGVAKLSIMSTLSFSRSYSSTYVLMSTTGIHEHLKLNPSMTQERHGSL